MFVNREKETDRIKQALGRKKPQLIVIYGRRRCGKSTLIKHVLPSKAIYFSADTRETPLQIAAFALQAEKNIPGFSKPAYPDWESFFISLDHALKEKTIVCIDEFPYLVRNRPELPSILQKIIDNHDNRQYHLVLCGSAQQMMHSMVLDSSAPLYGRCDEIIKIRPMAIRHMKDYFSITSKEAIMEYGVWGGVPRYWEIRKEYETFTDAIKHNILDQNGVLFEEPERLFSDELRTSVQAYSVLSLIGAGIHRVSEISARLGKPATQLSRILGFLINLGYIRRETPYGASLRSTKKGLYKIDDPFLHFYFAFLLPNKSRLELGMLDQVWDAIEANYDQYLSMIWENLCRKAVPFLEIEGLQFNPAARWWGGGLNKQAMEIDIVALSTDKQTLLIGEAKWSDQDQLNEAVESLKLKEQNIPFPRPARIIKAVFQKAAATHPEALVFSPDDIVNT